MPFMEYLDIFTFSSDVKYTTLLGMRVQMQTFQNCAVKGCDCGGNVPNGSKIQMG